MLDRTWPLDLAEWRMDDEELLARNDARQQDGHGLAVLATGRVDSDEGACADHFVAPWRHGNLAMRSDMDRSPQAVARETAPGLPFRREDTALRLAPPRARRAGNAAWTAFPVGPPGTPVGDRTRGVSWYLWAMSRDTAPPASLTALAAAMCLASGSAVAGDYYLRGGIGLDWPGNTAFTDTDCSGAVPAALYGYGTGGDGAPYRVDRCGILTPYWSF